MIHVKAVAMERLRCLNDCSSKMQGSDGENVILQQCENSDYDDNSRMRRREKNRVAAQKSRKRQTQRADELHEAYACLEQRNRQLRREVASLSEEQHRLLELLQTHEPCCPMMHCSTNLGTGPRDVTERPLSLIKTPTLTISHR
ncbi:basic leucine zipper transcriptional factor ATF-like 3 [Osmerus mordax]|uniref:basic leucine zipper transcriptional factor ATF-like 3 n=1 Tax=Osmerus mordax TaxID=8014 RepID=UPI00350FFC6D